MTSREPDPLIDDPFVAPDPHELLFGTDERYSDDHDSDDHDGSEHYYESGSTASAVAGASRGATRAHRRRVRRHRRTFVVMSLIVVLVVLVAAVFGYQAYQHRYHPKDYAGSGTGTAQVVIHPGDSAETIGAALVKAGVVQTSRAFSNAAKADSAAQNLAPGTYKLREHMSATAALGLLLDPSSRLSDDVVVFPGSTVFDVSAAMSKSLGVSVDAAMSALKAVSKLGLPSDYTAANGAPLTSVEGFLYPATYSFDPGTGPVDAVQEMITKFIDVDRANGLSAAAAKAHLTPYAALIIASIAEKEAKKPADYPKVARVVLNRIAAGMPLQIDATSAYAAKLAGLDPTKVVYAEIDSPYNTYTHRGLPPTPIADPGADATNAAVHPVSGNWLYYVNADAQGDLYFTNDEAQFEQAVAKCRTNNWGCG